MPTYLRDTTPAWLKQSGKSVTDSQTTKTIRAILHLLGADDPMNQIMAIASPLGVPEPNPTQKVAEALAKTEPKGIKAYHGSPHDFEKFSSEHIGKGEGAQAYGHGLYFAEHPEVAKQYRDALSARPNAVPDPVARAQFWASMMGGRDEAVTHLENILNKQARNFPNAYDSAELEKTRQAVEYLKSGGDLSPMSGRMYEVNINASPEQFLDWDKPLSQQPQSVKDALDAVVKRYKSNGVPLTRSWAQQYESGTLPGKDVYAALGFPQSAASESAKRAGIPGLKYLDQVSRASGEGTRNYVVFDDQIIEILKKYGLLPAAVGAGYGAQQQLSQPSRIGAQ